MARISEKHLRYRTKQQIAEDIAFILKAPLTYGTKYGVLAEVTWVWTEFDGKINGCPFWSKMAIMQRKVNPKAKLKHEHVVPKKVVIGMLFALENPTQANVMDILSNFLIGVVVTPEEDDVLNSEHRSTMPREFFDPTHVDYHDPWLRYQKDAIEIVGHDGHRPITHTTKRARAT